MCVAYVCMCMHVCDASILIYNIIYILLIDCAENILKFCFIKILFIFILYISKIYRSITKFYIFMI